jgi:hypothetical protein
MDALIQNVSTTAYGQTKGNKMDRIGTNFKDEQAAQNWANGKAKFNSKIEKIDGGWRVTWDVKSLKNAK